MVRLSLFVDDPVNKFLPTLLLTTAALALAGCSADRYHGTYYPDPAATWRSIDMGQFASFQECRNAAQGRIDKLYQVNATYRCDRG